jgi:hypothetical protein
MVMGVGRPDGDRESPHPFVHRGRSVAMGVLSALTLALVGMYVFGSSASVTVTAQYVSSLEATGRVEGVLQPSPGPSSTSHSVALVFRNSRGDILERVTPRVSSDSRFIVAIHNGSQSVAVTIASGQTGLTRRYQINRYQSLKLRARFHQAHAALLTAAFPQIG